MKNLLAYLIKNATGVKDCKIKTEQKGDYITYVISPPSEVAGLIIGKEGKTIKAISRLIKVKATLEKKMVNLDVSPL
jgi:predicted RNA-binding protein YlqC (UPF0109 family)